jgi:hypothetical protein
MKSTTDRNVEANERMKVLAEISYKQAKDGEKQTQAMVDLAYETKRDSEVMKTITAVTLMFLPATFVCVSVSWSIVHYSNGSLNHRHYSALDFSTSILRSWTAPSECLPRAGAFT